LGPISDRGRGVGTGKKERKGGGKTKTNSLREMAVLNQSVR